MTWIPTLLLCAASSAAVGAIVAVHYRSRLRSLRRRLAAERRIIASSSEAWLQAQRKLAEIHNQHVAAGKRARAAQKALRDARTEDPRLRVAARNSTTSCGDPAAPENGRIGQAPAHADRTRARAFSPDASGGPKAATRPSKLPRKPRG